ncbi:hypothetical protein [Metapseudomonas sp. CR1201]
MWPDYVAAGALESKPKSKDFQAVIAVANDSARGEHSSAIEVARDAEKKKARTMPGLFDFHGELNAAG